MKLVHEVQRVADQKGCTIGQIALAWVRHHSGRPRFPDVIPIPGATTSSRVEENSKVVVLTDDEFEQLNEAVKRYEIVGTRYP